MKVGDRVFLNDNSPWPERRGHWGTVVAPPVDGTYPQPSKSEVLVRLDNDPLPSPPQRGWSCVVAKSCVGSKPSDWVECIRR